MILESGYTKLTYEEIGLLYSHTTKGDKKKR